MIVSLTRRDNDHLYFFGNDAATNNLQKFPVNLNPFFLKYRTRVLRDRIKSVRGERENRRPCARQTNAQETWMRGGSNGGRYFRQAGDLVRRSASGEKMVARIVPEFYDTAGVSDPSSLRK